ncbi:MAG: metallophosphoesterase [Clostridia bacterium]|nr:metallophosphoesterase [Clostridia bacterium]
MKRILSLILIVCLALGVFSVCASAAGEDGLKLIVTSDTHWQVYDRVDSDGFYRPRHDLGQMTALTPMIMNEFFIQAGESDADAILLTGDLTNSCNVADARAFAALLADFEDSTGKRVFVIDGNHDLNLNDNASESDADQAAFKEIYYRFGYDEAVATDEKTASYAADLDDEYRLLAIDSNKPDGGGYIGPELMDWIETQVKAAKADGKKLIAMMHHHIMEHVTLEQTIDGFYIVDNYREVCRKFDRWNIRLTFTGHMHKGDIASYSGLRTIYDASSTALSCYPLSYRYVRLTDKEIAFESRKITSLDVSLAPDGYSEEQLDMIANDPAAYAYGGLEDSFVKDYLMGRFVNADAIIDLLGLDPGSDAAAAVRRFMPDVFIPLYGEGNTVQAQARSLGLDIPESDYETVADLLTEFFARFKAGDEDLGGNSLEGRLVLDSLYTLLAYKAAQESEAVRTVLSSRVIAVLGLKGIDNIFTRSALDVILTGLFIDKAPADNNVTLPGYGAGGVTGALTILWMKLSQTFDLLLKAFAAL